ncbi:uncharacterized protein LOC117824101 [Xyrichtys novacula]|uniref:Uncharacterized protein LOC117824101 n=1 Tax=Xyrichtys novacula TaxID=13765 RepID=A0AAV1GU13_XYRNO|nr:uncharacterized protein LOC117824101 [Xyrichtys novacula]
MEKITQDDPDAQTESELKSPLSPKRLRTDSPTSNNLSGENKFNFPMLLTFGKTIVIQPSTKNPGLEYTAGNGDPEYRKTEKQLQDTVPVVIPIKRTSPHDDEANAGSPNACFIAPERSVLPVKDEQPPANETDKLSSYPPDDAGGALAESHTSKDAGADSSSQPDCNRLGKSLEDKPPGGCNLPAGDDKDGRQVQNSVSQIQAFSLGSSDEEVRCLSDCTFEGSHRATGFSHTCAEGEACNQRRDEDRLSENILLSKTEANGPMSSIDYAEYALFCSNPEEDPSGDVTEGVKNEQEITEMQICENENVAVCDGETKARVNENGTSENSIPSAAAERAEGSVVSYDMVLVGNIGTEKASLEADDFCGANGAHAACNMIAKTESEMADHTTETPMPARISQGPAEGDNDAGPFGVIDPAIWSERDREAEETCCNSESTELSQFVKICGGETPLRPHIQSPREDDRCREDKKEDLCRTHTEERQVWLVKETHNKANNEGSPRSSQFSPLKASPTLLKEQCFPASLDDLLTQEVDLLWAEIAHIDGVTEIKEEIKSDVHGKLENPKDIERKQEENDEKCEEDTMEMSIVDLISVWAGGEITNCVRGDSGNNLECSSDHPSSAAILVMEETTEGNESKEEEDTNVNGSFEMLVELINNQLQGDEAEASPDECVSEQTEVIMSQNGDKLILNSKQEQSMEPCCYSDYQNRPETDDLLDFTFPPSSDAVVPGPHELRHSQNPTAFTCSDRFSPVSAFFDHLAFDTFEKIQLSQEYDGVNDAGLSSSPLPETPQQQLSHPLPEAESKGHEEEDEEDVDRFECHTVNMANGLSSRDYSCDELSNFISAADVPTPSWPEQKPNCESACKSSEDFQEELKPRPMPQNVTSASDVNNTPKFEMKKQFNKVLKELNLFFDVSRSEFSSYSGESSPEQGGDVTETGESGGTSDSKDPLRGCEKDTSSEDADEVHSLDLCGGDQIVSRTHGSGDGEQEVPLSSCQEVSMDAAEKHREPQETEPKRKTWSSSFMCLPFMEELSYKPPEPSRRLEPLQTCTRPLRVGLSKRAKTKHLHRPHPYK